MKNTDVMVAGAGIAGLAFATRLAGYGHHVTVLEPARPESLGHDWWDTIELRSFDLLGLDRPTPPEARTPFRFKVNVNGETQAVQTGMPDDMVNIERRLLAARMVSWALNAGVDIRFGHAAIAPIMESGTCAGVTASGPDGKQYEIKCPVTVDATGATGALRKKIPAEIRAAWGFDGDIPDDCIMHTWRGVAIDTSNGGDSVICMGRGNFTSWISREPDGLVDVFAGVLGGGNPPLDAGEIADSMVKNQGGIGEWVRPGSGCLIPLRRPFDGLVAPGFLLLGDSACMANPINGSGMTVAIDAAVIASETVHAALISGKFDAQALWSYPARFFRSNSELAFLDVLKSFTFNAPRDPMLDFFKAGGLRGPAFWKMRGEFKPNALVAKARAFMNTSGAPALLAPMAATLAAATVAEGLYLNYPAKYNRAAFQMWRKMLNKIA